MSQPQPSQMPGTDDVGVPRQFADHPLLNAGPYFTLPKPLLQQVVAEVGEDRFRADLLAMEYALSDVSGDHSSQIGFWGGQPINSPLLRTKSGLANGLVEFGISQWGKSANEMQAILAVADKRLDWADEVRRGYCGWLMTNRTFLEEQSQIFRDWAEEVAQSGVPKMGLVVRDVGSIPGAQLAQGRAEQFLRAFETFFIRWRLESMPAPFVPHPMGVHLPVSDLRPVLGHMRHGGTTFYLPDIWPVPSRDQLRDILEEALRNRHAPEYLREWFEIVHSDNVAKNQIPRYARVFRVQHFLRALYARHAAALERKKSALIVAFSQYLGVSDDTIERDLHFVTHRLGSDS